MPADTLPPQAVEVADRQQWRHWLARYHTQVKGVWLVLGRKGGGHESPSYEQAVEEALCFGWIDSKPAKLDHARSLLWFAPRQPKSAWSAPNKKRVLRLEAAGLMHESGQAKVDAARKNGQWQALDAVEALEVPADLLTALTNLGPAAMHFEAFPRSVKRGILEWISTARQPATRTRRIEQTATLAQRNERANQWQPGKAKA